MFDLIAPRYDLLNRLTSLGMDQPWRRATVRALKLSPGSRALDLATGTADLALMILRKHTQTSVVGLDPSSGMLAIGERKVRRAGLDGQICLIEGDAQDLPFPDHSFDALTMAFGIRNVPDRGKALAEMARVTRSRGRIGILELTWPEGSLLAPLARLHVRYIVPTLGAILSRGAQYNYLRESISAFPRPEEFGRLIESSGLDLLSITPFAMGACCLFVASPR